MPEQICLEPLECFLPGQLKYSTDIKELWNSEHPYERRKLNLVSFLFLFLYLLYSYILLYNIYLYITDIIW